MKKYWLSKKNRSKLIVFYNGWGMDETPFLQLTSSDYDVLIFYDYNSLPNQKIAFDESYYKTIFLGFSFGAFILGLHVMQQIIEVKNSKIFLINGNFNIISKIYGINPSIFEATLEKLSESSIVSFYKNLFLNEDELEFFLNNKPKRKFNSQYRELLKLKTISQKIVTNVPVNFSLISRKDKIIPSSNQKKFCIDNNIDYKEIESGHFPFFKWRSWDEMLSECD